MAQPVWVLSVDLQTKTATFQSGMADAAKSARGAFTDIKSGAGEMAKDTGANMFEARHGVMLLGEEFGIHLPRALTSFIASIGPIGAAMEAAFPFLAIAVGATLLIEHLVKLHEAGEKLTQDQARFATAVQMAFNSYEEKLLSAEKRTDELRGDHLGALRKELQLIDMQSMAELIHQFDTVAKAADVAFGDITSHWYSFGIGASGAKDALNHFQVQYAELLAKGDASGATGLLTGTLGQAEKTLAMMKQFKDSQADNKGPGDYKKFEEAAGYLEKMGVMSKVSGEFTQDEAKAQQVLVDALRSTVQLESMSAQLKKDEKGNATLAEDNRAGKVKDASGKEAAGSAARIQESQLAVMKAGQMAMLDITRAGAAEREAVEISFADRENAIKQAEVAGEIAALYKGGEEYNAQLKALQDKGADIEAQHAAQVAEIRSRAMVAANEKSLRDLEQSEKEQIEITQTGSVARLAAIDAAIKEEESKGLQDTTFYRDLCNQKLEATRQMQEEQAKMAEEAGKEEADAQEKAGASLLASMKETFALYNSTRRASAELQAAEETEEANQEFQTKQAALQHELDTLDKFGKDYQTKLKALQDKEKQLVQQHENDITNIKDKAEQERNQRILSADQRFNDTLAQGLTNLIMRHQNFAQMMTSLSNEVVSGMLQNAIKSILADDMTKERDAAYAARQAFKAGMQLPFPANVVAAPVMAAGAFTAVMAFAGGVDSVPGFNKGDTVPARLEPGEGVVPGGVMDGLSEVARSGGFKQQQGTTVHIRPTYHVNTIDGDGMRAALNKHSDQLEQHMERAVRRLNK